MQSEVAEPTLVPKGRDPPSPDEAPYLKAHLHSGGVALLSSWIVPSLGDSVLKGVGMMYDSDRAAVSRERDFRLSIPWTPSLFSKPTDARR